ncbi:hypothetical protein IQ07DRAFT_593570 [Pyrenochaeta sp. DS3sAY3a]|nr:hypothetical protein IQ07DRAFT_593570 [Pyrenochaeta sp. DS3sAY3a]
MWGEETDGCAHPPPLQDLQGPPRPGIRKPLWTTQPPGRPEQATASHQSHRVCRADADPWASGDQRRVNDSRALGGDWKYRGRKDEADASTNLEAQCSVSRTSI